MAAASKSRGVRIVPLLIAVCLVGIPAQAKYESGVAASAETSTYVFVPDQSKLVQTGGIAGVHWTYSIKGQFELVVDPNAGAASFAHVDANATDDSPFKRTLDVNHVFNMTSLVGTVIDDTKLSFTGKASDGSDVSIMVMLQDGSAHLIGQTTPPPHSADFFIFSLDAVAQLRKYSGGSGTAEDPYQIATAADLIALGETPEDYDKHFILTADIDVDPNRPGGKVFDRAVIAPDTDPNDEHLPFQGSPFTGVFDGRGHKILHLTIAGVDSLGLFGQTDGATISDIGLEAIDVNGTGEDVGGLVGENLFGSIVACYSTGAVTGDFHVGGLVGANWRGSITSSYSMATVMSSSVAFDSIGLSFGGLVGANSGSITSCYSTGIVNGEDCVGGLVGGNDGDIIMSYSTGTVTGETVVGGLIGENTDIIYWIPGGEWHAHGKIIDCHSSATVAGIGEVGGLVGMNIASINTSYSTGTVTGQEHVGGLVGTNYASIIQSYSTSGVSGSVYVGGLVGLNGLTGHYPDLHGGSISMSYSTGMVVGNEDVGGLVGIGGGVFSDDSFWDMETSDQITSAGGTGKTTTEMKQQSTFEGWDFTNVWGIGENQTYPYLRKYSAADINQDASVNFLDLAVLAENWLTGGEP